MKIAITKAIYIICIYLLSILLFSCAKTEAPIKNENKPLYGKWKWVNNTNYLIKNDSLIYYSVIPGDSSSYISFLDNGHAYLHLLGTADTCTYTYNQIDYMLSFKFLHFGISRIDTVKILTSNLMILHSREKDTISLSQLNIHEFLSIDTLVK